MKKFIITEEVLQNTLFYILESTSHFTNKQVYSLTETLKHLPVMDEKAPPVPAAVTTPADQAIPAAAELASSTPAPTPEQAAQ